MKFEPPVDKNLVLPSNIPLRGATVAGLNSSVHTTVDPWPVRHMPPGGDSSRKLVAYVLLPELNNVNAFIYQIVQLTIYQCGLLRRVWLGSKNSRQRIKQNYVAVKIAYWLYQRPDLSLESRSCRRRSIVGMDSPSRETKNQVGRDPAYSTLPRYGSCHSRIPRLGIGRWQKMMYKYMDLGPLAFGMLPDYSHLYYLPNSRAGSNVLQCQALRSRLVKWSSR